jgi:hypothetical protein
MKWPVKHSKLLEGKIPARFILALEVTRCNKHTRLQSKILSRTAFTSFDPPSAMWRILSSLWDKYQFSETINAVEFFSVLLKNTVLNSRQICGFSLYLRRDVYHNLQMVFRTIFIQYLFQEETVVQNYLHTICFEEETVTHKFQTLLCLCVDYRWKRAQV